MIAVESGVGLSSSLYAVARLSRVDGPAAHPVSTAARHSRVHQRAPATDGNRPRTPFCALRIHASGGIELRGTFVKIRGPNRRSREPLDPLSTFDNQPM